MFSTAQNVRALITLSLALFLASAASISAQTPSADAAIYRVFLLDGDALVSYGEFARVGDRVVLSVPLGDTPETLKLQMVSVPANQVDWPKTDEYTEAVRAKRYAETRGEDDYTLLAARVTSALNDIHLAPDPKRRVAMAEEARRNLAAWPAANHGYRAADVAQLVEMLDGVVAEMRAEAGDTQFDLSLVAGTVVPGPKVDVLPPPDVRGSLVAAVRAALLAEPGERIALLRAVAHELSFAPKTADWAPALRKHAEAALAAELRVETAYGDLARTSMRDAAARAQRGDVRGLQQVIAKALATDDRLGRQRTGEMASLLAELDLRLDEARRVKLAQDTLAARAGLFRDYQRAIDEPRRRLAGFRRRLEEIRARRSMSARTLQRIEIQATIALQDLARVQVPPELHAAHGLYVAALQMARNAAALRRNALSSKHNSTLAWDASSAAAGALMLTERAAGEVDRLISASTRPPR